MLRANRCPTGKYAEKAGTLGCKKMTLGTMDICQPNVEALYALDCQPCQKGTFSNRLGRTSNKCCKAGYAAALDECTPCQVGFYQNMTGQSTCMQCNLENSTSDPASKAPNDCYVSCPRGKNFFVCSLLQNSSVIHPSELNPTKMEQVIMLSAAHFARCVLKI
jgi:hypothetical protein